MMSHNSSIFFGGAGRSPASTVTGNNINGDSNEDHGGEGDDGNGLESKLQGLAAALRKDRDVAHRTHQLAAEKLHLKQEEAEAARKTLESTEAKLVERIGSVEKVQAEVHGLQREVDILNAKVRQEAMCRKPRIHCGRDHSLTRARTFLLHFLCLGGGPGELPA
jgi:hypothetical protein